MKSAAAMLSSADPPRWIVVVDQLYNWFEGFTARTRVVISEFATLDVDGEGFDAPATTLLTGSQCEALLELLDRTGPEDLADADERLSLEGSDFVVMVANSTDDWCEFAEFRLGGDLHVPAEVSLGNQIKNLLYSFRELLHQQAGKD